MATVPPPIDHALPRLPEAAPAPVPRAYETYERPGLVVAYAVGPRPIRKGSLVGLDDEGLLVPIGLARCLVGVACEAHVGCAVPREGGVVNVACEGSFVFGWYEGAVDRRLLQRAAWAADGTTVTGVPGGIPAGRIVGIETTSDGRPGVRVKIDQAAARCLPPL